jgi:hypothetical protein
MQMKGRNLRDAVGIKLGYREKELEKSKIL